MIRVPVVKSHGLAMNQTSTIFQMPDVKFT